MVSNSDQMVWQRRSNGFAMGRLSFHPIPCGTALFGHVTSGATYTAYNQVGSGESLAHILLSAAYTSVSRWT